MMSNAVPVTDTPSRDRGSHACQAFTLGVDVLLSEHRDWLAGQRLGLVSHAAARDRDGVTSAEKVWQSRDLRLTALLGPEHGYEGLAAAGEWTRDGLHPHWRIPIHSLYNQTRKPTPAMLAEIDTLVVDIQDLGARAYTYVSTLRLVLEAAAETGKRVIVCDRPVPLPLACDGPSLDPRFESFVAMIPAPLQYGMTPAETASWLTETLDLRLDLRLAPMRGYHRETEPGPSAPAWTPPSPRIRSWASACCFTATVCGEALPALDYGSGTEWAFQLIGAPWLDADRLALAVVETGIPGLSLRPFRYTAASGLHNGRILDGLRLHITDAAAFRPVRTCVALLSAITRLHGQSSLWNTEGARPDWFDKLMGTDAVRLGLQANAPVGDIVAAWDAGLSAFDHARRPHLLYTRNPRNEPSA
jgi:uncharacterized protein YbbC (DUF1343 family)